MTDTSAIKEHMDVIASCGRPVGKVDHLEGPDKIKLTKADDPGHSGHHHLIPVSWVDHVDQHVHLNKSSKDVQAQWKTAA